MDFMIIANAWCAGKDNPTSKHRIALELVRRGHRVLWIEGSGMRAPSVGSSHDRMKMVRKVVGMFRGVRREEGRESEVRSQKSGVRMGVRERGGGLWVLSPLFVPMPRYEVIRRLNGLICRLGCKFWGLWLGFREPVLINYVPVLAEAMHSRLRRQNTDHRPQTVARLDEGEPIKGSLCTPRTIYHCVDRWDKFGMYDSSMMAEMDRRCCVYADLVIASAGELYDRCRRLNPNTILISHGVDWEHFRHAVRGKGGEILDFRPQILDSGINTGSQKSIAGKATAGPVIGFFGLLSEWVDQELILKLAREIPEARLLLIGKADVDVTRLQGVNNIQLEGPKPFSQLPEFIAQFTVGIIPFEVNDLTRAVNPIKLREMLASGCPVVSTALPEVERCVHDGDGAVQVAHSHDEFVAMVRTVVGNPFPEEKRQRLSDSMVTETWSAKVDEILRCVGSESES